VNVITKEFYATHPIGFVRSALVDLNDAPRQGSEGAPPAVVEVRDDFTPALDGIVPGSELIVLTWLHLADRGTLRVHPRDDLDRPLTGVFATRSPDRPNPIGLHRVRVLAIEEGHRLHVAPLEAVDGTPVLDLKPVLNPDRVRDVGARAAVTPAPVGR
jgi:tRNA-Thr(GGU) m(6)t(6)A37 methyltransferase TsaA